MEELAFFWSQFDLFTFFVGFLERSGFRPSSDTFPLLDEVTVAASGFILFHVPPLFLIYEAREIFCTSVCIGHAVYLVVLCGLTRGFFFGWSDGSFPGRLKQQVPSLLYLHLFLC